MTTINETYLKISQSVYGIQPDFDHSNVIDRNEWEQLSVNVLIDNGTNITTYKDSNGNDYYSTESNMSAAAYRNKTSGEIVIAYRGTDQLKEDASSILSIINGDIPAAQLADAEF